MLIGIVGIIIGVLILAAGIYYMVKEKDDPEAKKIYTIASIIGAVITAAGAIMLFTSL